MLFKGCSKNTIDAKGRITVPARWRPELSENLVVMYGMSDDARDRFLQLMSAEVFEKIYGEIANSSMTDSAFGKAKRFILSNAEDVTPDKSDRILIPQHLIRYAGLSGEITLLGVGDYIEIWDPKRHDESNDGYDAAQCSSDTAAFKKQRQEQQSPASA